MTDKQKVLEFERKIRQIQKRALRLDNETRRTCEAIVRETSRKIQDLILASAPAEGAFPARVVIPLNGQIAREVNLMTTQLVHMIDNGKRLLMRVRKPPILSDSMRLSSIPHQNFFRLRKVTRQTSSKRLGLS